MLGGFGDMVGVEGLEHVVGGVKVVMVVVVGCVVVLLVALSVVDT